MRYVIRGLAVGAMALGFFFLIFRSDNNGVYLKTGYLVVKDCNNARLWVQSTQPIPSPGASPSPTLLVSPMCYQEELPVAPE